MVGTIPTSSKIFSCEMHWFPVLLMIADSVHNVIASILVVDFSWCECKHSSQSSIKDG